uniref:Uncharacterized protein n=2 Tax=Laurencieae TaxID=2008388 RepID=A0AA51NF70_9FLOR|nr:hypothetical protein RU988_pgp202 [Laurencia elata]YP_010951866.1 hypothetical protein RU989_pgp206 [Laurencia obtusa]WMP12162.1 hypothetical protein [Laurencia verruciformis]WMP12592.1 hypothetical protein [Laurencia elata]WMP12805.1 hypothetical protein [Laurencia obtusa]
MNRRTLSELKSSSNKLIIFRYFFGFFLFYMYIIFLIIKLIF